MESPLDELGVLTAFCQKLEEQSIPRTLAIKKRIAEGEALNEIDILFLEEQLSEAGSIIYLLNHHPGYQGLIGELANLYHEITEQALANQLRKN